MEQFVTERMSLLPIIACNLNCKGCVVDAPYRREERNLSLEQQKKVIEKYFTVVSYVKKFSLSGGECLLYRDLPELLNYLKNYIDQIGILEIVTNGTICPNGMLLEICQQFGDKITFLVDNYGKNISTRIDAIDAALNQAGIHHTIRNNTADNPHCGGWVEYGDPREMKKLLDSDAEVLFSKCASAQKMKFCFGTYKGIMYPCEQVRRCIQLGVTPDNPDEYVNLLDDTLSVEEMREKIRNIYQMKRLSACAYCKGLCEESERFPPAEQLTDEELKCVQKGARSYSEVCRMMEHII